MKAIFASNLAKGFYFCGHQGKHGMCPKVENSFVISQISLTFCFFPVILGLVTLTKGLLELTEKLNRKLSIYGTV
jgi:hypothetical protein